MWRLQTNSELSQENIDRARASLARVMTREDLGFKDLMLVEEAIELCGQQKEFFSGKSKIVVIGLGGSSLGAKAVAQALRPYQWENKLVFLDNVDNHSVDALLTSMNNPEEWGWLLCSKSGGTIEVVSLFDYCSQAIEQVHGFSIAKNTLVITEEKDSPLSQFAEKNNCPKLPIPTNVGGRFSVLTCVGLFPLASLGINLSALLDGYRELQENPETIIELAGLLDHSQQNQTPNFYCFQYSDRMSLFGLWLQQLWSESLAKAETINGDPGPVNCTFIPCRGTSDQHSVLQQIVEGREQKLVGFHQVESSEKWKFEINKSHFDNQLMQGRGLGALLNAELVATEQAVQESGSETFMLSAAELDEKSMGFLLGLWMLTVATMGDLMEIDAFNQPGVESGKIIARRVLGQSI